MTRITNRFSLQLRVISALACIMAISICKNVPALGAEPKIASSTDGNPVVADPLQKPATFKETEDTFRTLAPKLHWLEIQDVLFHQLGDKQDELRCCFLKEDVAAVKEIGSNRYSVANLISLLKDADAKVRTLAIVALYNKEDPFVLPDIAALSQDGAKTIPKPIRQEIYSATPDTPTEKQTVGQVAGAVIDMYMWKAGYIVLPNHPRNFAKYWEPRKNRKYCASWFAIKLVRVGANSLPNSGSGDPSIRALRKQLGAVPKPDKDWILLRLKSESGFNKFATESDLIAAMKELGPDRLLQMLQGKISTDDPDLQPRPENYLNYQDMMISILKRAKQVLRKDQADALLACGHNASTPWFAIAAAQLNPEPAAKLLRDKLALLDSDLVNKDVDGSEKADLAAALWKQYGLKEKTYLIDRFYNPNSFIVKRNGRNNPAGYREAWLSKIADNKKETQELIKDLINDNRFSTLNDYLALVSLTRAISLPDKVIWGYDRQLYDSNGLWASINFDEALRKEPDKTKHMLTVVAEWRKFLRDTVNHGK